MNKRFSRQRHKLHARDERCRAFLVCIDCGHESWREDGNLSDTALAAKFREQGWTMLPTRCPKCRVAQRAA